MATLFSTNTNFSMSEEAFLLPEFIPGFNEKIDYFMKDCDFGDVNDRNYFNKYSNMFVFGFYLEKKIVTEELLRRKSSEWTSKDKYWDNGPSEVIDVVIV